MDTIATWKRSAVLLAPVTMLALAGCGDGDTDGAGDAPAATTTATVTATASATVTATETATETVTATPPRARGCGQVGFEPNTDAGAFDIRARGVGCQVAREVAAGAEGQGGEAYAAARGFECTPTGTVGELPSVVYECTGPEGGTVSFQAS